MAERIAARKGIGAGDARALRQITKAVDGYLRRRRPAVIERIADGRALTWRVVG